MGGNGSQRPDADRERLIRWQATARQQLGVQIQRLARTS